MFSSIECSKEETITTLRNWWCVMVKSINMKEIWNVKFSSIRRLFATRWSALTKNIGKEQCRRIILLENEPWDLVNVPADRVSVAGGYSRWDMLPMATSSDTKQDRHTKISSQRVMLQCDRKYSTLVSNFRAASSFFSLCGFNILTYSNQSAALTFCVWIWEMNSWE